MIHAAVCPAPREALPLAAPAGAPVALVINPTASTSGPDLAAILADRFTCPDAHAGTLPVSSLGPGLPGLPGGVLFTAGEHRPPLTARNRTPGLLLVIRTGPDAGRIEELVPGRYWLGRPGRGTSGIPPGSRGILMADPAMSRVHAELDVSPRGVTVTDCASRNGLWVDGKRVRRARLTTSSLIRTGDSSFQVGVPGSVPLARNSGPGEPLTVTASLPRPPGAGTLAASFLPLGLGIVLAATTGMWFFLAFSGLGALTAGAGLLAFRRRRQAFRRAVAAAAGRDRRRRQALYPDPGELALTALVPSVPPRVPAPGEIPVRVPDDARQTGAGVNVRLGSGTLPANLVLRKPDENWQPPLLHQVPVTFHARPGTAVSVCGPRSDVLGLCRSMLLQLGRDPSVPPGVILLGGDGGVFDADARLLPGVQLLPSNDEAAACSVVELACAGAGPAVLALAPPGLAVPARRIWNALPERVRMATCLIVCEDENQPGTPDAAAGDTADRIVLGSAGSCLSMQGQDLCFLPDLVGPREFHRAAVRLASLVVSGPAAQSPAPCPDKGGIAAAWQSGLPLRALIGSASRAPVTLDLIADGPHLLVAGTTGSGKSELLRTLVASLACQVPPTRLNFLLIDFKGGSGLAPLAGLPHTAGFLTDLSPENVARALSSLRAELLRRETLLAQAHAPDLDTFNARTAHGQLPRLAVVIDEFRMLADSVPHAVEELMRIAALGRSLGLHLVMATQRPQGAVTADIRANVSACLCLRVQSALDSRDVVGCDDAAAFPASAPGRAVLRLPGEPPLTFQSVSTSADAQSAVPAVQTLAEFLAAPASMPRPAPGPGLDRITAAVRDAAAEAGYPSRAPAPVQPPLPEDLGSKPEPQPGHLRIGLADQPAIQAQDWLDWDPKCHSHLALLGLPHSGSQAAASVLARQHTAFLPGRHLYVLDGDGSLRWTAERAQTGAYVPPHETGRAARVLAVLSGLLLARLTGDTAPGLPAGRWPGNPKPHHAKPASGPPGAKPGSRQDHPGITVLVSGWGRWQEALRAGRLSGAEDLLLGLIRDGAAADICLLMTGSRELAAARFFQLIPNRLWFPAGLSEDALLGWPRMPELQPLPGRAFVQGPVVRGTVPGAAATAQCYLNCGAGDPVPIPAGTSRPRRIDALPHCVRHQDLLPPAGPDSFPVGLGGDELETVQAQVQPGSVFLVLGPPRSGRTTLLETFAATGRVGKVFRAGAGTGHQGSRMPPDAGSLRDWLVLADDADRLSAEQQQLLARLADREARLVLSAAPSFSLVSRLPLAGRSGPPRDGVLLAPGKPADGEFFGVRLELDGPPRTGRGYLFTGGQTVEVQFAAAAAGGQGP
ncbi:MAG: FtsK/SpoIIIE domain-containing protein [Arthrobacter sp.]